MFSFGQWWAPTNQTGRVLSFCLNAFYMIQERPLPFDRKWLGKHSDVVVLGALCIVFGSATVPNTKNCFQTGNWSRNFQTIARCSARHHLSNRQILSWVGAFPICWRPQVPKRKPCHSALVKSSEFRVLNTLHASNSSSESVLNSQLVDRSNGLIGFSQPVPLRPYGRHKRMKTHPFGSIPDAKLKGSEHRLIGLADQKPIRLLSNWSPFVSVPFKRGGLWLTLLNSQKKIHRLQIAFWSRIQEH